VQTPETAAGKVASGAVAIARLGGQTMPYGVAIAIALLVIVAQRAKQL